MCFFHSFIFFWCKVPVNIQNLFEEKKKKEIYVEIYLILSDGRQKTLSPNSNHIKDFQKHLSIPGLCSLHIS